MHMYNCTHPSITGYSQYFLMYGCHPNVPINIDFSITTPDIMGENQHKYVQCLKNYLRWAYKKAEEASTQIWKCEKQNYDKQLHCAKLEEGNLVLIRQKAFKGKHKIADQWENDLYEVISKLQNMQVYKVKLHNGDTKSRTWILHQNMLFPLATSGPCESDSIDSNILDFTTNDKIDIEDSSNQINQESQYQGWINVSHAKNEDTPTLLKGGHLYTEGVDATNHDPNEVVSITLILYLFTKLLGWFHLNYPRKQHLLYKDLVIQHSLRNSRVLMSLYTTVHRRGRKIRRH